MANQHIVLTTAPDRSDLLVRLWRGEVGLAKTFWLYDLGVLFIYGLLFKFMVDFCLGLFGYPGFDLSAERIHAEKVIRSFFGIMEAFYFIFMRFALWRSASRYKEQRPDRRWLGTLVHVLVGAQVIVPILLIVIITTLAVSRG